MDGRTDGQREGGRQADRAITGEARAIWWQWRVDTPPSDRTMNRSATVSICCFHHVTSRLIT